MNAQTASSSRSRHPLALALLLLTMLLLASANAWAAPKIKRGGSPQSAPVEESSVAPEPFIPAVLVREPIFDPTGVELGFRVGSFSAFDDWIDSDGTADYGGLGFIFRWRFDESWAVGLALDVFARAAESDRLDETRLLTDIFVAYYLMSPDWFQLYLPFGILVSNNELNNDIWDYEEYTEVGPYVGLGIDFYADSWRFNAELRSAWLMRGESSEFDYMVDYHRVAPDSRAALQMVFGVLFSL